MRLRNGYQNTVMQSRRHVSMSKKLLYKGQPREQPEQRQQQEVIGRQPMPVPSDLSSPKLSNELCTTCSETNVSSRSAGEVCLEISWKRAFLQLGSSLFRKLASLARKFLVILLSFEQPSTTGGMLGGEDFIAFTCSKRS